MQASFDQAALFADTSIRAHDRTTTMTTWEEAISTPSCTSGRCISLRGLSANSTLATYKPRPNQSVDNRSRLSAMYCALWRPAVPPQSPRGCQSWWCDQSSLEHRESILSDISGRNWQYAKPFISAHSRLHLQVDCGTLRRLSAHMQC